MENKQTKENRQFLGIWIPREIYLNKKLSWTDKILLIEIESLDNERGCFASNDYFAEFLGVTKTTISTSVSKLKKLGYIEQVSFDGRTRILKADFKKMDMQSLKKLKSRHTENLTHNKQDNKTINKTIKKEKKYIKKDFEIIKEEPKVETKKLMDDPKMNQKVNSIINGAICIDVKELKNQTMWLEHCSRYLLLNPFHTEKLLQQFVDEQNLKDDAFKSIKETKSHFLNWAKIEVAKNRRFGNDQWGRSAPNVPHRQQNAPQKQEFKPPVVSDEEKKRLHVNFITDNLLKPYNTFVKSGSLYITNFGGIVYKTLKKHNLLVDDQKVINKLKKDLESKKEKQKNRGRISKSFVESLGKTNNSNFEIEHIKISLHMLKDKKVNLEKIVL